MYLTVINIDRYFSSGRLKKNPDISDHLILCRTFHETRHLKPLLPRSELNIWNDFFRPPLYPFLIGLRNLRKGDLQSITQIHPVLYNFDVSILRIHIYPNQTIQPNLYEDIPTYYCTKTTKQSVF